MKKYLCDIYSDNEILENCPTFTEDQEKNPYITETAGFVPLDVKFKQMEQAGIRAQFFAQEFTSSELRDVYFGANTEIYPSDEIEEVEEKLLLQESLKLQILQNKEQLNSAVSGTETTESPSLSESNLKVEKLEK